MEISDRVRMSDLRGMAHEAKDVESLRKAMIAMMNRFDLAYQDLVIQLRSQVTIYPVDPNTSTSAVEGAKSGDLAVFINNDGVVDIKQYP